MENPSILDDLNPAQKEAVSSGSRHNLVLAGAGTGKTRVLVHRIAWLLSTQSLQPWNILAVTFTNKAAHEMRERVSRTLGYEANGLWLGTFHSLCHRMLRINPELAQLNSDFQIIDSDDQVRLIKRLLQDLELDEKRYPPRKIQWLINHWKDEMMRADDLDPEVEDPQAIEVYKLYDQRLHQSGLVDFGELILRSYELLRDNDSLREQYQNRLQHILVDEFQDTNTLQYAWLQMLTGQQGNLFVVGDDDQSIYGWRGAKIANMLNFSVDFADVRTTRLEQNYRSTQTILNAANAIINNNAERLGKTLWTDNNNGEQIKLFSAWSENDEADFVAKNCLSIRDSGENLNQVAILYRSNAQSRVIEEAMLSSGIPYRIYGGMRFFERTEIKDVLAYLRLITNRDDDVAFARVYNTPARGIGIKSLEHIRRIAHTHQCSLWRAIGMGVANQQLSKSVQSKFEHIINIIDDLEQACDGLELSDQIQQVINDCDLETHYKKEPLERAESRLENLGELITAASQHVLTAEAEQDGLSHLQAFLNDVTLDSAEKQQQPEQQVQLMTLHSAKGLEFPYVFIVGMEDGLFPSNRSIEERDGLSEERRLAYVGMTRAMKTLYLCWSESRRLYGKSQRNSPSRFLQEVPSNLLESVRPRMQITQPVSRQPQPKVPFAPGQMVNHSRFGDGIVIAYEGDGEHTRIEVNFHSHGLKLLVLNYANLKAV